MTLTASSRTSTTTNARSSLSAKILAFLGT